MGHPIDSLRSDTDERSYQFEAPSKFWGAKPIQGHHDGNTSPPENSFVIVNGTLHAHYRLKTPPVPRLITREEVEREAQAVASSQPVVPNYADTSDTTCHAHSSMGNDPYEAKADCLVGERSSDP
jgi:hypothetical protein